MTSSPWIDLGGAVNVRDLGGLPTTDGRTTKPGRLIRADNLQGLSPADVRVLVDEHRVRAIADLRTGVEVSSEGPGPMTREPAVRIEHLSLYPEAGRNTDAAALDEGGRPDVLPWQARRAAAAAVGHRPRRAAAEVYLGYLNERADSVLAALRLIAATAAALDGATIVHCAAGKDRTGVVVALALADVGVEPDAIVEDYVRSAERVEQIMARLRASATYAEDLADQSVDMHRPRAQTMHEVLAGLDARYGGASSWLRDNGWTEADHVALRHALLD